MRLSSEGYTKTDKFTQLFNAAQESKNRKDQLSITIERSVVIHHHHLILVYY